MKTTTKGATTVHEATPTAALPAVIDAPPRVISGALSLTEIIARKQLIEQVMKTVMREGEHYGASFPGDTKKNLLKPGADTLVMTFQLVASADVEVVLLDGDHRDYRVTCTISTVAGVVVAIGVGSCSTKESKYRWRNAARTCPSCGKAAIIKAKEEYGGGWLCFRRKDGCGATFRAGDAAIEQQVAGKIENPDVADVWNTCLKIAKKRALVDGAISATGCSDLFTQDQEDHDDKAGDDKPGADGARGDRQDQSRQLAPAPKQPVAPAAPGTSPAAAAASQQVNDAAQLVADLNAEYRTLKDRAGPKTASKFWGHWKLDDQRGDRLDAMRRANAALLAITGRLGPKADDILRDLLQDRADPDNVPGILADLEKAAGPAPAAAPAAAAPPPAAAGGAKGDDEPPYAPIDARVSI